MKTVKAKLIIEDNTISLQELGNVITGIRGNLQIHEKNIIDQITKSSSMQILLFSVMREGKSQAFEVQQIDLRAGLKALCKASIEVDNEIKASEYEDIYMTMLNEFLHSKEERVLSTRRFVGMTVVITKMADENFVQQDILDKKYYDNLKDYVFVDKNGQLTVDVSMAI